MHRRCTQVRLEQYDEQYCSIRIIWRGEWERRQERRRDKRSSHRLFCLCSRSLRYIILIVPYQLAEQLLLSIVQIVYRFRLVKVHTRCNKKYCSIRYRHIGLCKCTRIGDAQKIGLNATTNGIQIGYKYMNGQDTVKRFIFV